MTHRSDCDLHNAPAYPPGPCSCGAWQCEFDEAWRDWAPGTKAPHYLTAPREIGIGMSDRYTITQGGDLAVDREGFALMRPDDLDLSDPESGRNP